MKLSYLFLLALMVSTSTNAIPIYEEYQPSYYLPEEPESGIEMNLVKRQEEQEESDYTNTARRYYRPYFRIRRVYRTRSSRPIHPLSNYADSYDRFPTVA